MWSKLKEWFTGPSFPTVDEAAPAFIKQYFVEAQMHRRDWKKTPLREGSFIVLDTETTGLDPEKDRILSFGAVRVIGNRIIIGESMDVLLRQTWEADQETVAIHGMLPKGSVSGLTEAEFIKELLLFIEGSVLVAHHAYFDFTLLSNLFQRCCGYPLVNPYLDTVDLVKRIRYPHHPAFVNLKELSLDHCLQSYDIQAFGRHTAAGDALLTAHLFVKLLLELEQRGIKRVGELIR